MQTLQDYNAARSLMDTAIPIEEEWRLLMKFIRESNNTIDKLQDGIDTSEDRMLEIESQMDMDDLRRLPRR